MNKAIVYDAKVLNKPSDSTISWNFPVSTNLPPNTFFELQPTWCKHTKKTAIFGLLKDWTVDTQKLKDELRKEEMYD